MQLTDLHENHNHKRCLPDRRDLWSMGETATALWFMGEQEQMRESARARGRERVRDTKGEGHEREGKRKQVRLRQFV